MKNTGAVLAAAGLSSRMGDFKPLLAMREELPVVHPLGCYDREGTYYYWAKAESERCPYQDTVLDYEALVYNHSLDRKKLKELFVIAPENSTSQ